MAPMPHPPTDDQPVLVQAPLGRDGPLLCGALSEASIACVLCADADALEEGLRRDPGHIGAVLLTEEALSPPTLKVLTEALRRQPSWSDLPVILLAGKRPVKAPSLMELANLVQVERPVRPATLLTTVRAALRARGRQHQTRVYLLELQRAEAALRHEAAELERLNQTLEQRVAERTALAEQRAGELQRLALELTRAEQRERNRLAQVLHDHLQQMLVAARMQIGVLRARVKEPALRAAADQAEELLAESIRASRSLSMELNPPALAGGLTPGLRWLAGQMQERHGLSVALELNGDAEPASDDTRLVLFHAVRELLFNVVRHAGVGCASVAVAAAGDRVRLVVEDAGEGFDPGSVRTTGGGLGLFSIRERLALLGGHVEVESRRGAGTRVTLHAPARGVGENLVLRDAAPRSSPQPR